MLSRAREAAYVCAKVSRQGRTHAGVRTVMPGGSSKRGRNSFHLLRPGNALIITLACNFPHHDASMSRQDQADAPRLRWATHPKQTRGDSARGVHVILAQQRLWSACNRLFCCNGLHTSRPVSQLATVTAPLFPCSCNAGLPPPNELPKVLQTSTNKTGPALHMAEPSTLCLPGSWQPHCSQAAGRVSAPVVSSLRA